MSCETCKYFLEYPHDKYDGVCRFDPHFEWRKKSSWCGKFNSGQVRRVKLSAEYTEDFKEFWAACPKKVAQDTAWKAWSNPDKLPPLHYKLAIKQMKLYALHVQGKDQKYVKHPATWINGGCWKDVLEKKNNSKACVDCYKSYEVGFKFTGLGKDKKYRCPECADIRNNNQ
jgi:hypothetical protein